MIKSFYEKNEKTKNYRPFNKQLTRQIKRDTIADIIGRFEENSTVDENRQSGRSPIVGAAENKVSLKCIF